MKYIAKLVTEGSRIRVFLEDGQELGGLFSIDLSKHSKEASMLTITVNLADFIGGIDVSKIEPEAGRPKEKP